MTSSAITSDSSLSASAFLTRAQEYVWSIQELRQRSERNKLAAYKPYPKQLEFHNAGRLHRERLFMAANQVGKTWAGACEWAMHLTGRYPDWWCGREFKKPVRFWAAGETGESTRDNPQRLLVGPYEREDAWGTEAIPHDALLECKRSRGVFNQLDSVIVRWGGGGDVGHDYSSVAFKAYEKGRRKWQGETLNGVWFDEEPPLDIYTEGLTRTNATDGMTIITFTPLLGLSNVVLMFLDRDQIERLSTGKLAA